MTSLTLSGRGFLVLTSHDETSYKYHSCFSELFNSKSSTLNPKLTRFFQAQMAPRIDDDWSDSDDEALADVETAVLLGVPDGPIESATDLSDAAVSRIGGHPVRYVPLCMYRSRVAPSLTRFNTRHFFHLGPPRYHVHPAKFARRRWNYWCRYGAPLKIVLTTGLFTFGLAQGVPAKRKPEGMHALFTQSNQHR